MDRVSDGELSWQRGHCTAMLKSAQPDQRETWRNLVAIIDELRERRAVEHGVVHFKWQCRCGHVNIWSWPMVEYEDWVPTTMECDSCHEYCLMKERPEVIHGALRDGDK